jgi:glyoxylase I family protein
MTDRAFTLRGIDHLVLRVDDLPRSLAFYRDVLGMRLERVISEQVFQLRCGRNLIDLMPRGADADAPLEHGMDHFCLQIQGEVPEILEHLRTNEVPIRLGPVEMYGATGFGTSIYVTDPDGYTVELKTDHAEHPITTTMQDVIATLSRTGVSAP